MAEIKQQVGESDLLENNKTYKLYFKNTHKADNWYKGNLILEHYQLTPIIRMHFNDFIIKKDLDIINYFLDYNRKEDYHELYFDTLDNVEGIKLKQITDYLTEKSSELSNIDLKFLRGYIITNKTAEEKEQENKKDNVINDFLDNQGIENIENILKVATAIYLLSIIKDFTE